MSLLIFVSSNSARESEILDAIEGYPWLEEVTQVIRGTSSGTERFGEKWAQTHGREVIHFNPEYMYGNEKFRQKEVAQNADCLLACYDGYSSGAAGMIGLARQHNLKTAIYYYKEKRFEYMNND